MRRFRKILLAAALDRRDATTFRHVGHIARAAQTAAVHVAHVTPELDAPPGLEEEHQELAKASDIHVRKELEQLIRRHADDLPPGTAVDCISREGSVALEVSRIATEVEADLVAFTRLLGHADALSDLTIKVLRTTPCSTLVIPDGSEPRYERILVPIDFSGTSREALDVACAIGSVATTAQVTALHVDCVPEEYRGLGDAYDRVVLRMKQAAKRRWDEMRRDLQTRGVRCEARFEWSENVPEAILHAASQLGSDLIVIASHGLAKAAMPLLGHVPEVVCSRAHVPVLCVKRRGQVVGLLQSLVRFLSK